MKRPTKIETAAFYYFLTQQSKGVPFKDTIAEMKAKGTLKHLNARHDKVVESFKFTKNNVQKLSQLNDTLRGKEQYLIDEFKKMQTLFMHQPDAQDYSFELQIGVYLAIEEEYYYRLGNKWEFITYCDIDTDINDSFLNDNEDYKEFCMTEYNNIRFCYSMHLLTGMCHSPYVTLQDLVNANHIETIIEIKKIEDVQI
jgi:hypothetical protein